jgi:hypothetical protein
VSTTTSTFGWVVRSVTLGSGSAVDTATIEQRGYGFEVVAGAQYCEIIQPIALRDTTEEAPLEYGEVFDGVRRACPGGFVGLFFKAVSDLPFMGGVARVVVRIYTRPIVVAAEESGLSCKASVGLLNSSLHPDLGDTMHVSIPAGTALLVHDDVAGGFQANVGTANNLSRSRTIGDERRVWWPTHSLYFYGFIATNCPAASFIVDILAYLVDANGAAVIVPYHRMQATGTAITVGYTTLYSNGGADLSTVVHFSDLNNRPSQGILYPMNGCQIWLRNQDASSHAAAGILGVRSA